MPDQEDIENHERLLTLYRRNLSIYLDQQARQGGSAHATITVRNGIVEARAQIHHVKLVLRGWDIQVRDHPDDELPSQAAGSFIVPFMRNLDFVGREDELARLHSTLINEQAVGIRPTGLTGMGGIGKTQLAVEYAYQYKDAYPSGILWVNAAESLKLGIAELGKRLRNDAVDQPDTQINAVIDHLRHYPESLLILDNLAFSTDLNQYVNYNTRLIDLRCRILFTTRNRNVGRLQSIEVTVLSEDAALRLLLRYSSRHAALEPNHIEHTAARAICQMLGWLPLALEIAGAFLGEWPDISLADLQTRLLQEGCLETLEELEIDPAHLPAIHEAAVAATLRTQLNELNDATANLLLRVAGQLPEGTALPDLNLGLLANLAYQDRIGHPSRLAQALKRLKDTSLVEELPERRYRLHPLVHAFAAQLTPDEEHEQFRLQMVANVIEKLQSAAPHNKPVIVAGECLLSLGWNIVPESTRQAFLQTLSDTMCDEHLATQEMRGLPSLIERIARLVYSPEDCQQLVACITPILNTHTVKTDKQLCAQLLSYQAAMRLQSGDLDHAADDYAAADRLIDQCINSPASILEDHKIAAQIKLGSGRVAQARANAEEEPGERRKRIDESLTAYLDATKSYQEYKNDILLEVAIHNETSYIYALLEEWESAVPESDLALNLLEANRDKVENTTIYARYRALVLETASQIHFEYGQKSQICQAYDMAIRQYRLAYQRAQQEIAQLANLPSESKLLIDAHMNAGDYALEISRCLHYGDPTMISAACTHWQAAAAIAGAQSALAREVEDLLTQHCSTQAAAISQRHHL